MTEQVIHRFSFLATEIALISILQPMPFAPCGGPDPALGREANEELNFQGCPSAPHGPEDRRNSGATEEHMVCRSGGVCPAGFPTPGDDILDAGLQMDSGNRMPKLDILPNAADCSSSDNIANPHLVCQGSRYGSGSSCFGFDHSTKVWCEEAW